MPLSGPGAAAGGVDALPHGGVEHQVLHAPRPHRLDAAAAGPRAEVVVPAAGRVGVVPRRGAHRLRLRRQRHRRRGRRRGGRRCGGRRDNCAWVCWLRGVWNRSAFWELVGEQAK